MGMTSAHNQDTQTLPGVERPAEGLQPAPHTSRWLEAGGLRLHYLDYGTAGRPPILCIHGGAAHAHWFDFFAPGFCRDYHVRALDLRGHGDSQWMAPPARYTYQLYAADVAEAVEALDLQDLILIGHSMGGMVSILYAAAHPERLRALIVVDSSLRMTEDRVALLRDIGGRPGSRYASREEFMQRYRLRPAGTTAAPEIIRHLAACSARQLPDGGWTHKFDRNVYAQREPIDSLPYWSRIAVPTLLVKGDRSPRISPQLFAEVRQRCPQVELVEVPHSDHHVFLDNPPGFERAVKAFLARCR
jgi:pimeloyl-ACP methyl ester carboxylesterase